MWVQVPLSLTMKIKNNLKLDYKKRNLYTNLELPINLLKIITNNKILNNNIRNEKGLTLNTSLNYTTKIRKICLFTSRMRGNITNLKMNRTVMKQYIKNAKLNGFKSASW